LRAGDPKKAVVLGAVAVAILGVAVFRILPRSDPGTVAGVAATAAGVEPPDQAGDGGIERALRRNPFYHPGLDLSIKDDAIEGVRPELEGTKPLTPPPPEGIKDPRTLPRVMDTRSTGATQEGRPAESAGSGQQEKQKLKVVVNAVLEVARSLAYVSVDGEEFRVSVGDELPRIGRIVSITSKGVVVKTPSRKVTILVGESVEI